MKLRRLGKTDLRVSEIGFGCWAIGGSGYGKTRDEDSLQALETAWQEGVNFFDTADTYGHGHSEKLLAHFLREKPRESVIIASKAGWDFYHPPSRKTFEPDYLKFACDESLKRLSIDTIDLYQLHNPGKDQIASGQALNALETLKRDGKIRFIGVSVHREEEAMAAIEDGRVDTVQLIFSVLDQRMAANVFREARKRDVGIIAREPLSCGMLTGKYGPEHEFGEEDHRRRWSREKMAQDCQKIDMIRQILATDRLSLPQAALEFVLDFEAVSTVIPGAKTSAHVLENLKASNEPLLRAQESAQLREIFLNEDIFSKGLIPRS